MMASCRVPAQILRTYELCRGQTEGAHAFRTVKKTLQCSDCDLGAIWKVCSIRRTSWKLCSGKRGDYFVVASLGSENFWALIKYCATQMGLGKTLQSISLLAYLRSHHCSGPFRKPHVPPPPILNKSYVQWYLFWVSGYPRKARYNRVESFHC